jgi:7-cyano-7-deazaguanine reductase
MLNITDIDGNNLYESAEEAAANDAKNLKSLGSGNTKYPTEYDPSVLERFPNPNPGSDDLVGLDCFEFRSLCVSGDTMIDVCRDESRYPDGIPIRDLVGTEGYVFSFDTKTDNPVVRKYKDVRMTRKNAEVVKVIMKYRHNCTVGTSEITCTPDHMFLVRKGFRDSEWVKAIDLKPDMRLIASQNGQDTIRGLSRHRLIGEALFDEDLQHIHHKDGNHFNNSPDNLMNMSQHDSLSYHRKDEYGYDSSLDLPSLNHKVVAVVPAGNCDVYNMEVEDTECFFANDIVIHNCPLTHQPDLATIHISYIPNKWMVESKSIKLYLFSYANHGAFHERCVHTIMEDLVKLLNPKYLEVYGDFNSRGGVCILPFAQHSTDEYEDFKKARKLQMMDMFTAHKPRH